MRYKYIDGLRGIAILMVIFVHVSGFSGNNMGGFFYFPFLQKYMDAGTRGVQLFFIISAFTLYSSSIQRFAHERYPLTDFYIRRAFRILPAWWLVTFIYSVIKGTSFVQNLPNYFFYFGFIRFDTTVEAFPLGWTLFVEETFYILLPFLVRYITRFRKAVRVFIGCCAAGLIWHIAARLFDVPRDNNYVFTFPLSQWMFFPLGIALFFCRNAWEDRFIYIKTYDVLTALSLLLLLPCHYLIASIPLMMLFFSAISEDSIFGKAARNELICRYGKYCYSIYLTHYLIIHFAEPYQSQIQKFMGIDQSSVEVKMLLWFPLVAVISLGMGFIGFELIEKPSIYLGKRLIIFIQKKSNKIT